MPDNIIERALVPFNPSSNTVLNKDKYNLFAPVANVNKVGMAGFNPEDFNVSDESIVSFSATFRADIEKAVTDAATAKSVAQQAAGLAAGATLVAGQARDTANAAKQTAEAIDGKATEAQQDAADALEQVVGKYTKPESGIPSADLSTAVQTSLGKADTALQSESDPTVPSWAKQPDKPEYTAAEIAGLESITNLTNYYRKTETYTQTEVNNLISAIPKLTITVVAELPEVGDPTKIYVIGNKEYLWLAEESRYEQFGDLSVDLSDYYTKDEANALLAGKANTSHTHNASAINAGTLEVARVPNLPVSKITGLATVATSGSYNDLSDKPTIPTVPSIATSEEAAAGTNNTNMMTPLRVSQAIAAIVSDDAASITYDNVESGLAAINVQDAIDELATSPPAYTLPTASDAVKGGVKIGAGLEMDGEVLNATGGGTAINVEVLGDWS